MNMPRCPDHLPPDGAELFVQLAYHLRHSRTVALLMYLLQNGAHVSEHKATVRSIAMWGLLGQFTYREVRAAIQDLVDLGLVTARAHPNTRTHFIVNGQAVLTLLSQSLPGELPGLHQLDPDFLAMWRDQRACPPAVPADTSALALDP